jgi:hypothetical protein
MKFAQSIFSTLILLGPVKAQYSQGDIQINIYNGESNGCTDGYQTSFYPYVDGVTCYGYVWEGSTANAIVDCPSGARCDCDFFPGEDCGFDSTNSTTALYDECVPGSWASFICGITSES